MDRVAWTGVGLLAMAVGACDWNSQVVPTFDMNPLGTATLSATNVVPPSTSTATGTVEFRSGAGTGVGWVDYIVNIQNVQGLKTLRLYRGSASQATGTLVHNLMYEGTTANPNAPGAFTM